MDAARLPPVRSVSDGRVTIAIPRTPPSLNAWLSAHWRVRHRQKEILQSEIAVELYRWQMPACARVEATVSFRFPDRRRRDVGNFSATLEKCLGDALRPAYIPDDDHKRFAVVAASIEDAVGDPLTTVMLDYYDPRPVVAAA